MCMQVPRHPSDDGTLCVPNEYPDVGQHSVLIYESNLSVYNTLC
jgi:hypothetical protein